MGVLSTGGHAQSAVQADGFAVQVVVGHDVAGQLGELAGFSQARGEGDAGCQRLLHWLEPLVHFGEIEGHASAGEKWGLAVGTAACGVIQRIADRVDLADARRAAAGGVVGEVGLDAHHAGRAHAAMDGDAPLCQLLHHQIGRANFFKAQLYFLQQLY